VSYGILLRACLLLLLLNVAGGCSVKLAYNNLDRFARWGVSDYVDMNKEQRAYFDAQVAQLLYWHRTQQLPEYVDLLKTLSVTFADGTDLTEIRGIGDRMYLWYEEIEDRLVPIATEMLLSLDEEQVARLPEKFERDNEELAEDEAGLAETELQQRWLEEYRDGMSRFTGRLDKPQLDYLAAQSVNYIPQYELWADYRARWQADLLDLIREHRSDPEIFAAQFRALVAARIPVYYGEELTAVFAHNEKLYQEVTVWLLNNLSPKQRSKLLENISDLAITFRELRTDAPATAPPSGGCLVRC